jgi:ankyrin repeat protein
MKSLLGCFYRAAAWAGVMDLNNVLELASRDGHTRHVEALLAAGADIHTDDDEPLRTAAWWGRTETVKLLLEAGANVHAKDNQALRWAKDAGHPQTATALADWTAQVAASTAPRKLRPQ